MTDKELIQALRDEDITDVRDMMDYMEEAADHLEALLAENEHLREVTKMMSKWVSVSERLPERFTQVLLLDAMDKDVFTGELDGDDDWFIARFEDEPFNITHWMPLPEPPSTEGVE